MGLWEALDNWTDSEAENQADNWTDNSTDNRAKNQMQKKKRRYLDFSSFFTKFDPMCRVESRDCQK